MAPQEAPKERGYQFGREVIIQYIETYINEEYRESLNGTWININSLYADDTRFCMGFNVDTNWVHDFKLEESWSFLEFVAEHQAFGDGMDDGISDAQSFVMAMCHKHGLWGKVSKKKIERKVIKPVYLQELPHLPESKRFTKKNMLKSYIGKSCLDYLVDRGLGPEHIKKFGLTYSESRKCYVCHGTGFDEDDDTCRFCNGHGNNPYYRRIIIPTHENGNVVYYQGRTIDPPDKTDLRYMNPSAPRLQIVYFHDLLKENDDIYIAEGPIDAMSLIDYSCTCQMSMHLSDPQILKIARLNPKRVIFIPDWDETLAKRQRAFKKLAANMSRFKKLTDGSVTLGVYHWYNAFTKEELKKRELKDINGAGITEVDEAHVEIKYSRPSDFSIPIVSISTKTDELSNLTEDETLSIDEEKERFKRFKV